LLAVRAVVLHARPCAPRRALDIPAPSASESASTRGRWSKGATDGVPMKRIILFVAGLGIIFLASVVQIFGTDWLSQACRNPACFHLEWLAVGIVLSAAAYIAWKVRGGRR
jgi:hypothetical protein